jgi:hypothetical protein
MKLTLNNLIFSTLLLAVAITVTAVLTLPARAEETITKYNPPERLVLWEDYYKDYLIFNYRPCKYGYCSHTNPADCHDK